MEPHRLMFPGSYMVWDWSTPKLTGYDLRRTRTAVLIDANKGLIELGFPGVLETGPRSSTYSDRSEPWHLYGSLHLLGLA